MDEDTPPALHSEKMPHYVTIVAVSFFVLVAFGAVTFYVLMYGRDATTQGAIISTWNNLAVAAASFWLGSSLGGKMSKK